MKTEQEIKDRIEQLKDAKENFMDFAKDVFEIEALEWVLK